MGAKTNIEWTDGGGTWNPWYGCKKVSPGCLYCYAERDMTRFGRDFNTVTRAKNATFYAPLKWEQPRKIFTCSWSDFFIREADAWREDAWEVILATPQHTYQILTKRPGLMVAWAKTHPWPDHVWAGTSVESQKYVQRLDVLARVPAKVRFVSCEPLLDFLNLHLSPSPGVKDGHVISLVIVGGESGSCARPVNLDWIRSIRNQCLIGNVPLFLKQLGGSRDKRGGDKALLDGELWREMPGDLKAVQAAR